MPLQREHSREPGTVKVKTLSKFSGGRYVQSADDHRGRGGSLLGILLDVSTLGENGMLDGVTDFAGKAPRSSRSSHSHNTTSKGRVNANVDLRRLLRKVLSGSCPEHDNADVAPPPDCHARVHVNKAFLQSSASASVHRRNIKRSHLNEVDKRALSMTATDHLQHHELPVVHAAAEVTNKEGTSNATAQSVIVIGAGIAGVACALELQRFGYKVTVVEASDGAGGRCNTYWPGINPGAHVIQGFDNNPLIGEILRCKMEWQLHRDISFFCDDQGTEVNPLACSQRAAQWQKDYAALAFGADLDAVSHTAFESATRNKLSGNAFFVKAGAHRLVANMAKGLKFAQYGKRVTKVSVLQSEKSANVHDTVCDERSSEHRRWYRCVARFEAGIISHGKPVADGAMPSSVTVQENSLMFGILRRHHLACACDQFCVQQHDYCIPVPAGHLKQEHPDSVLGREQWFKAQSLVKVHRCMTFGDLAGNVLEAAVLSDELVLGRKVQGKDWLLVRGAFFLPLSNNGNAIFKAIEDDAVGHQASNNIDTPLICALSIDQFPAWLQKHRTRIAAANQQKCQRNRVVVETVQNINGKSVVAHLDCDAVVCTLPLGVMQSGDVQFDPPLPPDKRRAIRLLGCGVVNNVVLQFDSPFWERHVPNDVSGGRATVFNMCSIGSKFFWRFRPIINKESKTYALAAVVHGQWARVAENSPRDEIVAECLRALRKVFGDSVPTPTDVHLSKWGQRRFAKGSHSFVPVGESVDLYNTMAASVADATLLFAGAATTRRWPSTLHGAYSSGVRAARQLAGLRFIRKVKSDKLADWCMVSEANLDGSLGALTCALCCLSFAKEHNLRGQRSLGTPICATTDDGHVFTLHRNCALYSPMVFRCGPTNPTQRSPRGSDRCGDSCSKRCRLTDNSTSNRKKKWFGIVTTIKTAGTCAANEKCRGNPSHGASVECQHPKCNQKFHVPCAWDVGYFGWDFEREDQGKYFLCAQHRHDRVWQTLSPNDTTIAKWVDRGPAFFERFMSNDDATGSDLH